MEFRVLSGSQAGCRAALKPGLFRIGTDPLCDLLLDGLPDGMLACCVYVGTQGVAIESADLPVYLYLDSDADVGLCPIEPGHVFRVEGQLYAVDRVDAKWPGQPEQRPRETAGADEAGGEPDRRAEPVSAQDVAPPAAAAARLRGRRMTPLWLISLAGTGCLTGIGVLLLFVSLTPTQAAHSRAAARDATALEQVVAHALPHADLSVERGPNGSWNVKGRVHSHADEASLREALRSVAPSAHVQVVSDEDLESLARDALTRFPNSGVRVTSVDMGKVTVDGRVPLAATRQKILDTLQDYLQGMAVIDARIGADDDALRALLDLVSKAGLADRLQVRQDGSRLVAQGALDAAALASWQAICAQMKTRFSIMPKFVDAATREATAPGNDVLLAVLGPVPYVVLTDGTTEAAAPPGQTP